MKIKHIWRTHYEALQLVQLGLYQFTGQQKDLYGGDLITSYGRALYELSPLFKPISSETIWVSEDKVNEMISSSRYIFTGKEETRFVNGEFQLFYELALIK